MANLSITAANVLQGSNAQIKYGVLAGVTITAGQLVYVNPATGRYELADANTVATAQVAGVALHAALAGQPLAIQHGGRYYVGATVTLGLTYVLSATAGAIAPSADLTTGDYATHLGVAVSATEINIKINASGSLIA
jgi:hypothetical protein